MLRYYRLCEEGQWEAARRIEQHVQAWHAGPCQHLFARSLLDSALDRLFARAAGFIDIELQCRPPYLSATQEDLERYVGLCEAGFREFLHDVEE